MREISQGPGTEGLIGMSTTKDMLGNFYAEDEIAVALARSAYPDVELLTAEDGIELARTIAFSEDILAYHAQRLGNVPGKLQTSLYAPLQLGGHAVHFLHYVQYEDQEPIQFVSYVSRGPKGTHPGTIAYIDYY